MLLARIILGLKNDADINIQSVKVKVTAIKSSDNNADLPVNSMSDFNNGEKRNGFLNDAISELIGIIPEIEDSGYVEHERCLTVKADDAEVCIRPDAGVSRGWMPFGTENAECSDRDFRNDWKMDLPLFNKQKRGSGILYTVSYKQL